MPGLADCVSLLRLLIARGDPKAIPSAKGAIDEYLEMAPVSARRRGLRVLQQDAWDLHDTGVGVQRSFAETVDAYIARKLRSSEAGRRRSNAARTFGKSELFIDSSGKTPA